MRCHQDLCPRDSRNTCPAPSTFHTFTASQLASSCKPQPQPANLMSEVPDIIHRNGADPPCMPSCLSGICTSLFIDCLANTAPRTTTNHQLAACCKAMVRITACTHTHPHQVRGLLTVHEYTILTVKSIQPLKYMADPFPLYRRISFLSERHVPPTYLHHQTNMIRCPDGRAERMHTTFRYRYSSCDFS